jgi:hypothetical protein
MKKHPEKSENLSGSLGARKSRAILALLQCSTREKAAQQAGVNAATLWRWLKEPAFQEALRQARREAFSQSTSRLQQASSVAVSTLLKVMTGSDTPATARVQASRSVIELAHKSFQLEDLEARVGRLERHDSDRGFSPKQ